MNNMLDDPRNRLVRAAEAELLGWLETWREKHGLTLSEEMTLLLGELHRALKLCVRSERRKLEQASQPKASDYQDERFCDRCERDTQHQVHDSGHERDGSGDRRMCLVCGWTWSELTGEYIPPSKEEPC